MSEEKAPAMALKITVKDKKRRRPEMEVVEEYMRKEFRRQHAKKRKKWRCGCKQRLTRASKENTLGPLFQGDMDDDITVLPFLAPRFGFGFFNCCKRPELALLAFTRQMFIDL